MYNIWWAERKQSLQRSSFTIGRNKCSTHWMDPIKRFNFNCLNAWRKNNMPPYAVAPYLCILCMFLFLLLRRTQLWQLWQLANREEKVLMYEELVCTFSNESRESYFSIELKLEFDRMQKTIVTTLYVILSHTGIAKVLKAEPK